jgi:hypothetical protein
MDYSYELVNFSAASFAYCTFFAKYLLLYFLGITFILFHLINGPIWKHPSY